MFESNDVSNNLDFENDPTASQNIFLSYANIAMSGQSLKQIPEDYIEGTLDQLEILKKQFISSGNYFKAQDVEDAINRIKSYDKKNKFSSFKRAKCREITKNMRDNYNVLDDIHNRNLNVLNLLSEQEAEAIKELQERQKEEINTFNENAKTIPPKFLHYSNDYLKLATKENFLLKSKRYFEAGEIKEIRLKQKEVEERNMKIEWEKSCQTSRRLMKKKHQAQLDALKENFTRKRNELEISAYCEEKTLKRKINANFTQFDIQATDDTNESPLRKKPPPIPPPSVATRPVTNQRMYRIRSINYKLQRLDETSYRSKSVSISRPPERNKSSTLPRSSVLRKSAQ